MSCLDTTPSVIVLHFGIRASIELFAGIVSQRSVIIEKQLYPNQIVGLLGIVFRKIIFWVLLKGTNCFCFFFFVFR